MERTKQEAETILAQLGGRKFLYMTNGQARYGTTKEGNTELSVKLARNHAFRVVLNSLDLYDVTYFKMNRKCEIVTIAESDGIYADMLVGCFERMTGLRASL